jgi:hypothetical protein
MVILMQPMIKLSKPLNLRMRGTSYHRKWERTVFTPMWEMLVASSLEAKNKE